jgi:multicomponent Na+:H+ antiporter subunit B
MSATSRRRLFLAGGAALAALLAWGMTGLPDFGVYLGPYGIVLDHVAVTERHATNVVTAVNFDYRAVDTLGEEFILFTAMLGVAVLLREEREDERRPADEEEGGSREEPASSALRIFGLAWVAATALLGAYVVTHGHLTPGGGFQGGVIVVAALLLVYLSGDTLRLFRLRPLELVELGDGLAAGAYVAIGGAALVGGSQFLFNFLPKGDVSALLSGGTMPLISVAVGLEVTGALLLIISEFLDRTLVLRRRGGR